MEDKQSYPPSKNTNKKTNKQIEQHFRLVDQLNPISFTKCSPNNFAANWDKSVPIFFFSTKLNIFHTSPAQAKYSCGL